MDSHGTSASAPPFKPGDRVFVSSPDEVYTVTRVTATFVVAENENARLAYNKERFTLVDRAREARG